MAAVTPSRIRGVRSRGCWEGDCAAGPGAGVGAGAGEFALTEVGLGVAAAGSVAGRVGFVGSVGGEWIA